MKIYINGKLAGHMHTDSDFETPDTRVVEDFLGILADRYLLPDWEQEEGSASYTLHACREGTNTLDNLPVEFRSDAEADEFRKLRKID